VTSFDWRSQGGSRGDIAGGHLDSLDPLVGDLAELMAAWRRQYPGPRAAVAHSMGGHLLLRTLIEKAPPLDAAVLVAPMLGINSGPLPDWLAPWVARGMALAGRARARVWKASPAPPPSGSLRQRALTSCPDRYSDELWWWEREPGFSLGPPSWGWMNAAYRSCRRLSARSLAQVRTPVLLIGTARDRLVSPAAIRRAAERILGAELLMFDDAGHEILREADTVRLAALGRVDEFLDRHAVQ
jgi:lysophospholipase